MDGQPCFNLSSTILYMGAFKDVGSPEIVLAEECAEVIQTLSGGH